MGIFGKIFKKPQVKKESEPEKEKKPEKEANSKENNQEKKDTFDMAFRKRVIESQTDYARLKQEHSKYIPKDVGKAGIDQVIFWTEGVVSPDELFQLVQAFNRAYRQRPGQPDAVSFQQFVKKVNMLPSLCRTIDQIYQLSEFGKNFQLNEEEFWSQLQHKFCQKINKSEFDYDKLIWTMRNFALLKKGQSLYQQMQQIIKYNISGITVNQLALTISSFHIASKGELQTIKTFTKIFLDNIESATKESVVMVLATFKDMQGIEQLAFQKIEQRLMKGNLIQQMTVEELGQVGRSFGYDNGSDSLWKSLESVLLRHKFRIEDLQSILYGFMSTYRCSASVAKTMLPIITDNLDSIHPRDLAEISKNLYIFQIEEKKLFSQIEGIIIEYLRDTRAVDIDDLLQITKNYCVTRHGTRDIYTMLELVVTARMPEIKQNRLLFESFVAVYMNSDLCSVDLLNLLKFLS